MDNHERAVKAANERWHSNLPIATHDGVLNIGNLQFECDVLQNGIRIIRQKTFLKALGKSTNPSGTNYRRQERVNLPIFVTANNLTPYLEEDFLNRAAPIFFKSKQGRKLIGYDATILPDACKIYDQAERDGKLQHSQINIAKNCKVLLYALAKTGITALIDECTSYQEVRERNALQELMKKWVQEECLGWVKRFPQEFFQEAYRIHNWEYPRLDRKNHPQCLGQFINKYVYGKMPKELLAELQRINPKDANGNRKNKHHQHLTEGIGHPGLERQLQRIIDIMKVSDNNEQFKKLIEKI